VARFPLPRSARVRKRGAFVEIQRSGKKAAGAGLLMFVLAQRTPGPPRLGLTVSRRVGGAVVRNRVKRYAREVFRLNPDWFAPGRDYVFVARPTSAQLDFAAMSVEIARLCKRSAR
jgi:ribonuclease P protein component